MQRPGMRETALASGAWLAALSLTFGGVAGAWFVGDDYLVLEEAEPSAPWARFVLPRYTFLGLEPAPLNLGARPLLLATFALQRALFGLDPAPYHAFNLLAHLAATAALWLLCRTRLALAPRPALAASLAFLVHPEHVGAVTWISGRGAPLASALVLFGLLAWTRGRAVLAALLVALAMGVYELAYLAPWLLVALEGRAALRRASVRATCALSAVLAALHALFLPTLDGFGWSAATPVHAARHAFQLAFPFLDSPRFPLYSAGAKDLARAQLALFAAACALVLAALGLGVARLWRSRPADRRLLAAFLLAWAPALAYARYAPRTAYLASALGLAWLATLCERRRAARALLLAWILALGVATWDENRFWRAGGERAAAALDAAARGAQPEVPAHVGRLVPVFPGRESWDAARRLFPAGTARAHSQD